MKTLFTAIVLLIGFAGKAQIYAEYGKERYDTVSIKLLVLINDSTIRKIDGFKYQHIPSGMPSCNSITTGYLDSKKRLLKYEVVKELDYENDLPNCACITY